MTALLVLLLAATQPPAPAMLYRCRERIANFEGTSGGLTLDKSFREDGTPLGFYVALEGDRSGTVAVGRGSGGASVTMRWPGNHGVQLRPDPFSWAAGSIDIYFSGRESDVLRRGERWRRVVVDRGGRVVVHEIDGLRWLFVSGLDLHLTSEIQPLSSPGRLSMSLDGLSAWGSGRERVIVYETVIEPQQPQRNLSDMAIGRERVVGQYQIDMAALARLTARVRTATETWEAGLTDLAGRCEREPEGESAVVVTTR